MSNDARFSDEGITPAGDSLSIANEFTQVGVRKVLTRHGERLEITCPNNGYRILLDAMQLEAVAAQNPEKFSQLFAITLGSQ
jgi:hypothetical protein